MGIKLDPKDTASFDEVLISNVFNQEAMLNVLVRKGLLPRQEVLQEILELKRKS